MNQPRTIARRNFKGLACLICFFVMMTTSLYAQEGVPNEILERTFMIKIGNDYGTAFTIDYGGKIYLVTARHNVANLPASQATLEILRSGKWVVLKTVKTLLPSSQDVDIAVFETEESAA